MTTGHTSSWLVTLPPIAKTRRRVLEVLSYFDASLLARTATAPALFSVGLMDHCCPPSTVYAAFNAYSGRKTMCTYRYNDHEGGQFHQEAEQLHWLPTVIDR